jgi:hypothetical protein
MLTYIAPMDPHELPDRDINVTGPLCDKVSNIGLRDGVADRRGRGVHHQTHCGRAGGQDTFHRQMCRVS